MSTNNLSINPQLANGEILPLLIRLSIPAATAQIVNALYSIVDRMFIGHLPDVGSLALSGLGLTFPITMLIAAFSCLPGAGGAPLASIAIGEGDARRAQKILCSAFTLLLTISAVMTIGGLMFLEPVLRCFGADEQILPYAHDYLQVYLLGTVFVELALGLNFFINAQGFTLIGTLSISIGAVLNLILDPLFLYVFDMGIRGAALATVISQFAACVWNVWFLCSARPSIHLCWMDMIPDLGLIRQSCALGISPFTFRVNESLVSILLNRLILIYGGTDATLHLAVMAILNSISQIFFMPLGGIVSGAQPIISYNFGAKNYKRVRDTIRHARSVSITCAVAMWLAIMLFPEVICRIFTTDSALIAQAKPSLRLMFCTIFSLGYQMINQNGFVAMGNTKYSFLFGIMRKLLILVPLALILPRFFGVRGIYAAEAISNPVTTIITFIVFENYMLGLKSKMHIPSDT